MKMWRKDKPLPNLDVVWKKKFYNSKEEVIREVVTIWRDRKNVAVIKKFEKDKREIIYWVGLRMVVRKKMKLEKSKKLKVAKELNQKLMKGEWDYDVEIFLPSFS